MILFRYAVKSTDYPKGKKTMKEKIQENLAIYKGWIANINKANASLAEGKDGEQWMAELEKAYTAIPVVNVIPGPGDYNSCIRGRYFSALCTIHSTYQRVEKFPKEATQATADKIQQAIDGFEQAVSHMENKYGGEGKP